MLKQYINFILISIFLLCSSCAGGEEHKDTNPDTDIINDTSILKDGDISEDFPEIDTTYTSDPSSEPLAECIAPETSSDVSIEIVPEYPRPMIKLVFKVTSQTGYTNVKLVLCGPAGEIKPGSPDVYPGSPNLWVWTIDEGINAGIYQAKFSADPADTIYKTLIFNVVDDPADRDGDGYASKSAGGEDCDDNDCYINPAAVDICGDNIDQDCNGTDETCDFCAPPEGNIISHSEFEEGMSGLAPVGWEVRNPGMPDSCPGSPDSHVFIGSPPTGCTGHSLVIDAKGTWDCYAIQTVSGYFTIEAGHTYRISAVVKSTGNSVNPAAWFILGVQWVNSRDEFFGDEKNPRTSSAAENDFDWKILTFDLVAPPEATRILVWLTAHYPGKVEYDNISVVKID